MDGSAELRTAERALQAAILASDLDVLEDMLDDRLVHVGADGTPQDKRELIDARAAGATRIRRLEEEALEVLVSGETGVTRVTIFLVGYSDAMLYAWRVVGTRTWARVDGRWKVLAEHVSLVEQQATTADRLVGNDEAGERPVFGRLRSVPSAP